MSKPSQPPFWLSITDEYVVANFESLLYYVHNYNFVADEEPDNGDFLNTYNHLSRVAHQYAEEVFRMPLYSVPSFEYPDINTRLRIMGAALLTCSKINRQDHRLLAAFVMLIALNRQDFQPETLNNFIRIINGCINSLQVIDYGFSWNLIENFTPSLIEIQLKNLRFNESDQGESAMHVYEGHGTMVVNGHDMWLAPFKYTDTAKRRLDTELSIGDKLSVRNTGVKDKANVDALINLIPALLGAFEAIRPASRPTLKSYMPNDRLLVRVTCRQGVKVEAESIDPQYSVIRNNVFITPNISFIPKEYLLNVLKVGDYLPVILKGDSQFAIDLGIINQFVKDYAMDIIESDYPDVLAVYECDFKNGSRWLTVEGLFVNIHDNSVSEFDYSDYEAAKEDGTPCIVRFSNVARVEVDDNFYNSINANFKWVEPDCEFYPEEAYINFMKEFLTDVREYAGHYNTGPTISPIPTEYVRVLTLLIYRLGMADADNTYQRVEALIIAALTAVIVDNADDTNFLRSQIDFQKAVIGFAHGVTPSTLSVPAGPQDVALLDCQRRLVKSLRGYREVIDVSKQLKTTIVHRQSTDQTIDIVHKLISASNDLLDKIDISELNRIKKAVCAHLGVADEFKSITSETTNYGIESDFLEFKSSCVTPPAQWDTGNPQRNMNLQKWNILKAVCAFLNSPSGGELLIGVNDSGFAVGLDNDLHLLHQRNSNISTLEHLRTSYLKLLIDKSFATIDGSAKEATITSGRVQCEIETNNEGIEIIRVKVRPYEFNVVKITAPDKPDRFADCYIRTSGASTPMDKSTIRETKLRKINALAHDNHKLAKIMEAIDNEKQIVIKNYSSSTGVKTRHLEPYKITANNHGFIAFDMDVKKVRLFRFSRFASNDIESTSKKWEFKSKHLDLTPDIFGILEDTEKNKIQVRLLLSDYARNLLLEETSLTASTSALSASGNSDFPWKLLIDVNGLMGVARFVMGLPQHVKVVGPTALSEYIANLTL